MDQLTFEHLRSKDSPNFEAFYRIYSESLPLREQKPRVEIEALVGRPDYSVLLLNDDGHPIGFSVMFVSEARRFALLEYMAVHRNHRGLGYGTRLFRHAFETLAASIGPIDGVIEIDSVREACDDLEIRKRRLRFYAGLGCRLIDRLDYILPLPGKGAPPKMDLMLYACKDVSVISKQRLEALLTTIYQGVYHCPPDDARIDAMLAGLPNSVRLL